MSTTTAPDLDERNTGSHGPAHAAPATGSDAPLTHRQILEVMAGLMAGLFTALVSSTIVSTALPTIIADLHGTQRQYTWVIVASLLALTVTTPIWGKLSDLFSKKLLVQLSLVLFVAGSIAAGTAHDVPFLIACRVVQGIGMGGLTALSQSIIGSIVAPRERGRYGGYIGATMALATVSGPLLGGFIVDTSWLGWRWCFYVCVPLAIVALILLQITLKTSFTRRKVKIDYWGALLVAGAAALPLIWVTFAGTDYAWWSWQTGAFLGGAALLVLLAIVVELRHPEPMVPIRVLRHRTAALVIVASIAVGIAMFGGTTFLGQYFQLALGYTPTHAGLLTIPLMVGILIASTGAGQIITRTGKWKKFLVIGGVLMVAGLFGLGNLDHTTSLWYTGAFMAVVGLGMGCLMQNLVLAVQNTVDVTEIGASSAAVAFFRSLGGAVGVSVLGAVLANRVSDSVASGLSQLGVSASSAGDTSDLDLNALPGPVQQIVRAAYGDATGHIFWIAAVVSIVALVAVLFVKEVPLRTSVRLEPSADEADAALTAAAAAPASDATGAVAVDLTDTGEETAPEPEAQPQPDRNARRAARAHAADEPSTEAEMAAVSALNILTTAERTAQARIAEISGSAAQAHRVLDELAAEADRAVASFRERLAQMHERIDTATYAELGSSPKSGPVAGLRSYEFDLLRTTQETAEGLTAGARAESERLVTEARERAARIAAEAQAEIERREARIAHLREVEDDLRREVGQSVSRLG